MPDFKLEYLINNSPWSLTEIGLTDDPYDGPFYELPVGITATDIIFHEDAITFTTSIEFRHYDSVEEYLSYLYLDEIDMTTVEGTPIQRVANEGMAHEIRRPSIWSEAKRPPVTTELNGKTIDIPETICVFEYIPLPGTLSTVIDLRKELERLTGQPIYGISVP